MKVDVRPATAEDIVSFIGKPLACRARFTTIVVDGEIAALGGLLYGTNGTWASVQMTDAGRRAAVSLHRVARDMFAEARRKGRLPIFATVDATQPRAEAWMTRLGFHPTEQLAASGQRVWVLR